MKATPHKTIEGDLPKNKALSKNKENATQEQGQHYQRTKKILPKDKDNTTKEERKCYPRTKTTLPNKEDSTAKCNKEIRQQCQKLIMKDNAAES